MNREKAEVVVDAIINAVIAAINASTNAQTFPSYHHESARRKAEEERQRAIDALCPKPKEDDETC